MRLLPLLLPLAIGASLASSAYVLPCYFTNWAQYRPGIGKYVPEDYAPGLCTHIFYAFATITSDYQAKAFDETDLPTSWAGAGNYARVNALKQKQPGLKTVLSFGGYNFGTAIFKAMAASPANRATFVKSALAFTKKYGFDGIDIDWEYPTAGDKAGYLALITELKAAFGSGLVTAAVSAGAANMVGYDIAGLGKVIDWVNVMTYDFHGSWENVVGENSPLNDPSSDFSTAGALKLWSNGGMPKSKLLLGIGTYGRGWQLANPQHTAIGSAASGPSPSLTYSRQAGIATYYEICPYIQQGASVVFDTALGVPYLFTSSGLWFGYDNVQSVQLKARYVQQQGYGGAFVWTLDQDDFMASCQASRGQVYPLIRALNQALINGNIQPPNGNSTVPPPPPATTPSSGGHPTQPSGTGSSNLCPQPNGLFPYPGDCTKFVNCANNIPYVEDCPAGLLWDIAQKVCTWPDQSDCGKKA